MGAIKAAYFDNAIRTSAAIRATFSRGPASIPDGAVAVRAHAPDSGRARVL